MARAPLLQLSDVTLGLGGKPLFSGLDLSVGAGMRAALVGRNGAGKSTLMRVMAGLVEPDSGTLTRAGGATVGYLPQAPDLSGHATLGDYATATLGEAGRYRVEMAAEGLSLSLGADPATASGGERRRAALARLLAEAPDLMLLDEPTNHLDIGAITWLEEQLGAARAAFVLISHDRALLSRLTREMLWLDDGTLRRRGEGFARFEDWREEVRADEAAKAQRLDTQLKAEARWLERGVTGRRRRNQGRLAKVQEMRAARAELQRDEGQAAMALESGQRSGKIVIEAEGLAKAFEGRAVIRDFSIRVLRGERVAVIGPNGAGKTTLLRLLTGQIEPDAGRVRLGTNLTIAEFDQARARLDPEASLWDNLTGDPAARVPGAGDQLMVRGRPRHVMGYLREFNFDERRARAPVSSLSGGERARLLLAKLMARESNLLILDEPTNDLDVETLDLLVDCLDAYDGTVLMVSHDRDFLDRIATTSILLEGDGRATIHAGGWSAVAERAGDAPDDPEPKKGAPTDRRGQAQTGRGRAAKLGYRESQRLRALPGEIERLQAEIARLEQVLADPDLYSRDPDSFEKATEALSARHDAKDTAEQEWLILAEKAESLGTDEAI